MGVAIPKEFLPRSKPYLLTFLREYLSRELAFDIEYAVRIAEGVSVLTISWQYYEIALGHGKHEGNHVAKDK